MPFARDTKIRFGDLVYLTCQRTTPTRLTDAHEVNTDQSQIPIPNSVTSGFQPRDNCRVIKDGNNQRGREVVVVDHKLNDDVKVRSDKGRIRTNKREDLEHVASGAKSAIGNQVGSESTRDFVGVLTAEPRTPENMTTEGHSVAKIR